MRTSKIYPDDMTSCGMGLEVKARRSEGTSITFFHMNETTGHNVEHNSMLSVDQTKELIKQLQEIIGE